MVEEENQTRKEGAKARKEDWIMKEENEDGKRDTR